MPRISTWFALTAMALIGLGSILTRYSSLPSASLTLGNRGYGLPNSLLCYGTAACLCLFAFLYGIYFLPWSERAQLWHLGLSLGLLSLFVISMLLLGPLLGSRSSSKTALAIMLVYVSTPWLFVLLQSGFLADAIRRVLQGPALGLSLR